jgi:hypothetical protein
MGSLRTLHSQRDQYEPGVIRVVTRCGEEFGYQVKDVWRGTYPGRDPDHLSYQIVMFRRDGIYMSQVEIHTDDRTYRMENLKGNGPPASYHKTSDCKGQWNNFRDLYQKVYLGLCDAELY